MTEDTRCCGTGTCLIDANGRCWCGQQWDGEQMCRPATESLDPEIETTNPEPGAPAANTD
ncbi:MAG: hypothetical protein CO105_01055 [Comamonadaceae bacterium CG_4_9_14_3_um_filter_60_33]|nr:MAG: hypothetical protein AUK51_01980 [Comamonadaceae bacterium CG2_30_59_20]PIY28476.1 MAG: hypothetical protein COZ09_09715 [Comamonadaceae bacterium CG_4_10_14_3_um_filter_60_42]PJB46637.1 MAG: hypothetical protein CO105_01055 [Comamonadaceae bacterium CG_4_9_14_3_um_filter_60_33]